jgi:hypothetical protein
MKSLPKLGVVFNGTVTLVRLQVSQPVTNPMNHPQKKMQKDDRLRLDTVGVNFLK